jgi:TonB family protein
MYMLLITDVLIGCLSDTALAERHPLTWHPHCNFNYWSFVCPGRGVGMKLRVRSIGLVVALVLSASAVLVPKALAQNTPVDTAKRKVKTRVVPDFPILAKQMNVTGKVKIEVTISPDGRVTSTKVVGGSPLLVGSALDAIKRWRFESATKESTEIIEFDFN